MKVRTIEQIIAHIRTVIADPGVSTTLIQTVDLELLCDHTEAALAAPVPPADGASAQDFWHELVEKTDRTSPEEYPEMALIAFEELRDFVRRALSPSGTGAAEPVAWTKFRFLQVAFGEFKEHELRQLVEEISKQLGAAPPVRGDREAIARIASDIQIIEGYSKEIMSAYNNGVRALRDAILSLPVQPGAGERGSDAAEADRYFDLAGELGDRIQRAVNVINIKIGSINRSVAAELKKILDPENALYRQPPQSSREG